jgi:leucine zipper transcription factor-like protein 1
LDDTFTIEEVEEILKDIDSMVETEVETELFGAARTNVLLLQQIFLQAQKWHLDLDADLSALEHRYVKPNS